MTMTSLLGATAHGQGQMQWQIAALAALPPWFLLTAAALLGLVVGSFLNVVIHRLPRMIEREDANWQAQSRNEPLPFPERYDLAVPRSACPHCGHAIAPWENIPVLGYLLLRGRCSACGAPIPLRYPAVELASALFAVAAVWQFGPGWQALAAMALGWSLLALAVIDAETKLLPDQITQPLLWLGLLVNVHGMFAPLPDAVIGAVAGYLFMWTVSWLFSVLRGKEGMGYGDFKLVAALGGWFGWQALPAVILLSSLAGIALGFAAIALRRHNPDEHLPFGPFLAVAGGVVLFAGSHWLLPELLALAWQPLAH
ncbi:leader peptidase (prepilin peptidase)/N-methyltransferase [Cupriavidus gilardii J11]|uniref:Prepilin leader peptidase/N-methyltransferase n=1 Tax=Cupriavidus gilardii J11 TaxID=936133 RepID=A0A562B106_9BURK|nr:leader peptidase (prepilin peptidase)/N-methyltransferase [Cupriavidus gilardii J11]